MPTKVMTFGERLCRPAGDPEREEAVAFLEQYARGFRAWLDAQPAERLAELRQQNCLLSTYLRERHAR